MEISNFPTGDRLGWTTVDACTLPTSEKPFRLAAFDDLFRQFLVSTTWHSNTHSRLILSGSDDLLARTKDLCAAESACCQFFRFTTSEFSPGKVALDIEVPEAHIDVLASLVERAESTLPAEC